MLTVALIGGDGAGKTTIAKRLAEVCLLPIKYIYMGINPQAGKFSLPTSRLVFRLKQRAYRKKVGATGAEQSEDVPIRHFEYTKSSRGQIWTAFRLLNRLIEAWYRQLVSLYYQIRGYIVVYDRHPLFDTAPLTDKSGKKKPSRLTIFNHWLFSNMFPKPQLTIFLDAPSELLLERKGESTLNYLDRQRNAFLDKGKETANFICVDATQPLEKVFKDVQRVVFNFHSEKGENIENQQQS